MTEETKDNVVTIETETPEPVETRDIITRKEAMAVLGIGKVTLDYLTRKRKGFPQLVPNGRSKGYVRSEIEAWGEGSR